MIKLKFLSIVTVVTLVLSACGSATTPEPTPDIAIARTSAANTVIAEITLTAVAFTFTPEPTLTATPVPPTETPSTVVVMVTDENGVSVEISPTPILCDSMTFNPLTVDVNIPDGSEMAPNQEFVKTWKVKNDGSCVWGAGYSMIYADYFDRMSGQPQALVGVVAIGQEVEVSVSFKAPSKAGEYVSAWQMANAKGIPFGKPVYVKIIVK
jgi:hypothetical protein